MYHVTGTWAGHRLYDVSDLHNKEAVDGAIEVIKRRFREKDYSLPKCLRGSGIVPNILCVTAVDISKSSGRICRRADIKKTV